MLLVRSHHLTTEWLDTFFCSQADGRLPLCQNQQQQTCIPPYILHIESTLAGHGEQKLQACCEIIDPRPQAVHGAHAVQGSRGPQRVTRQQAGGYQQPEHKPFEGTALQSAWVELRTFLKVCCQTLQVSVLCTGMKAITRPKCACPGQGSWSKPLYIRFFVRAWFQSGPKQYLHRSAQCAMIAVYTMLTLWPVLECITAVLG